MKSWLFCVSVVALSLAKVATATTATTTTKTKTSVVVPASEREYRILPTAGMAYMDLSGYSGVDPDRGVYAGVLLDLGKGPNKFETGLSYLQAGAKGNIESKTGGAFVLAVDYIVINAAVKAALNDRGLYFKGGLSPMIKTRSESQVDSGGKSSRDNLSDVRGMDVLASVGLGFERPLQNTNARVGGEVSFNRGLLDINTGSGESYFNQGYLFSGYVSL